MWRKQDPNLTDRLIIKKLLPKFENKDAVLFSGQQAISQDASKYALNDNSMMQGINILRSMNNSIVKNNSYSVKDNIIADEMFGKTGSVSYTHLTLPTKRIV